MRDDDLFTDLFGKSTTRGDSTHEPWPNPADDLRERFGSTDPWFIPRVVQRFVSLSPSSPKQSVTKRVETYWKWFAVVLFIGITLDMITTMYAARVVGPAGEANPLVRIALELGIIPYTVINLAAMVIAIGCFASLVKVLRVSRHPYDWYVELGVRTWLGFLLLTGLVVLFNNVAIIVVGQSVVG